MTDWASAIIDLLADDRGTTSAFIKNFARSIELAELGAHTVPTYFAVDTMALADAIFESDERIRLVRQARGRWQEVAKPDVDAIIADLDESFDLVRSDKDHRICNTAGDNIGSIKFGKSRISLKAFDRLLIADIYVEAASAAIGADPNRQPLTRYLDSQDMFTVLFDDLALAYIDGALFRDEALIGGGASFLRHLITNPLLATTTSEKGAFAARQTRFAMRSVFRVVVDSITTENILICDDLGDEWADFIGVATEANPPMISFYHAKHGDRSLGASAFHDAVGQAIKNLGRLSLNGEAMVRKFDGWEESYRNEGAETAIGRLVRGGTRAEIEASVADTSAAPDVLRRVYIVTSSLSRADVEGAFAAAAAGTRVRANFVQLYWILTGFFSACVEIGAIGYVVCRP